LRRKLPRNQVRGIPRPRLFLLRGDSPYRGNQYLKAEVTF